jgi:hypothetical protein
MKDTLIPVDANVECTDGHAGFVSAVVVDPVRQEVTHVVVKTSKDTDRAVHLDQIERTEHDTIYLTCSLAELEEMHPFTETHYIKSNNPDYSFYPTSSCAKDIYGANET